MINRIEFLPVLGPPDRNGSAGLNMVLGASGSSMESLVMDGEGNFSLVSSPPPGSPLEVVATFRCIPGKSPSEIAQMYVVPSTPGFRLNGVAPVKMKAIKPGDLVTAFEKSWLVVRRFRPVPQEAPEEVRDKECYVCRNPLHIAKVCRCLCPTFFHLEDPGGDSNGDGLNCYLSLEHCPICGEEIHMGERLFPEPRSMRL